MTFWDGKLFSVFQKNKMADGERLKMLSVSRPKKKKNVAPATLGWISLFPPI
jgi:hypothetical protein